VVWFGKGEGIWGRKSAGVGGGEILFSGSLVFGSPAFWRRPVRCVLASCGLRTAWRRAAAPAEPGLLLLGVLRKSGVRHWLGG